MAIKLVTPLSEIQRRDVSVASTLVNPNETTCLLAGEWITDGGAFTYARHNATDEATKANNGLGFRMVFSEKGDYGSQTLDKVAVNTSFGHEIETDVYLSAGTYALGTELGVVANTGMAASSASLCGLQPAASPADIIVAVVTGIPSATPSGMLRVMITQPYQLHS